MTSSSKRRKIAGVLLLVFLVLLLAALTAVRIQRTRTAEESPPEGSETPPAAAEETPASPEAVSAPESTPKPTPEPTREPTPEPTLPPLREVSLCTDNLDEDLFSPAEKRGTVEVVQYKTHDYQSGSPDEIEKDLAVYLPWGYDENKEYDVLMLLHCAGADHRFWLLKPREYRTEDDVIPVSVPNMLDRMFEEGWCRPLIVIAPCIYLIDHQPHWTGNSYDYTQFMHEVGNDLLPYVAEHYATRASDGSREALRAAREHFGVLGASFGAYAGYLSVIADNYDLAAWYTFCGGGEIDPGYLMNGWTNTGTQDLPLKLLYLSMGEYDDCMAAQRSVYNLKYYGGPFTEDNILFTMITGWGHEDHSYLCGLFNSLQLFFRDENPLTTS